MSERICVCRRDWLFLTVLLFIPSPLPGDTGRTGSIPADLWTLTNLQNLSIMGNFLTSTIPPGFSAMTDIQYLQIQFNDLTGSLPDELSGMTALAGFFIEENFLTGTIPPLPSSLGNCPLGTSSCMIELFALGFFSF
mmetsp:Transcript_44982/g.108769  ORF Transcript_44982/g.108769 Transcript_44982/m.108769 type:complete len:137 (+) Transcript_44982:79-489(+)